MVKFSALPTLLSWIIVFPYFLCIANHTESNNRRINASDQSLKLEPSPEHPSTLVKGQTTPGMTRRKRSAPGLLVKSEVKSMNDNSEVKSKTSVPNSKTQASKIKLQTNKIKTRVVPNDSSIENNHASSRKQISHFNTTTIINSPRVIGKAVYSLNTTAGGLTLMDFNGPTISQEDDDRANSNHIRVKRKLDDSGEKILNYFQDDDKSNVRNELEDIYPDLIDESLHQSSGGKLDRKKRLNHEMLLPARSDLKNSENFAKDNERSIDTRQNPDNEKTRSPVSLESFSKYENTKENDTSIADNGKSLDSGVNYFPIADAGEKISKPYTDAIDNRYSKRRKKRSAPTRDRTTRKGGRSHRKGGKPGHRKKQKKKNKKKHKKGKKPGTAKEKRSSGQSPSLAGTRSEIPDDLHLLSNLDNYSSNKRGISHLVDDPQVEASVEKRDSGDPGSEIKIKKREVSENYGISGDKRTMDDEKNSAPGSSEHILRFKQHQDVPGFAVNEKSNEEPRPITKREKYRRSGCANEELRYYDDVYEPNPQPLDNTIEPKHDDGDKIRKEKAATSVQQMKELVEKLTGKVDELETYLGSKNIAEHKIGEKRADEEGSSVSTRSVDVADLRNATGDVEARATADKTDASKSKLDVETSGRRGGEEVKEKTAEGSTELKRSTRILRRTEASKISRNKRKSHRKWDRWTDWSSCSVTCGKGRQIRWRHCTHDCTLAETEMEEKSCQLPACSPGKFLGIF